MSPLYWIILGAVNIPVAVGLGKLIFDSLEDFFECVKFWFKPDILSWIDGEYWKDTWAEFRFFCWIALCAFAIYAEHWVLQKWVF